MISSSPMSSSSVRSSPPPPPVVSLSQESIQVLKTYKRIIQEKVLFDDKYVNPLLRNTRHPAKRHIIHENDDNPEDPLNLILYPCDSSYEEVIEAIKEEEAENVIHDVKESVRKRRKITLEDIPCPRCNCLPYYHRSDNPSIRCKVMAKVLKTTDPTIITNYGYCLSCLQYGTLCLMEDHRIPPNRISVPPYSCVVSSNNAMPISTHKPPREISRFKIASLDDNVIETYFPNKAERVFSSFNYVDGDVFYPKCKKDTEFLVNLYLKDIISSFQDKKLSVSFSIGEVLGLQDDIFVLRKSNPYMRNNGRPVLVVEVKYTLSVDFQILETAFGQLLESMLLIRSTYGMVDVFGILTDYNNWYFCCLPHSKSYAEFTEFKQPTDDAIPQSDLLTQRRLYVSSPISYNHIDLPKYIESYIIKGFHSRKEEVSKDFKDLDTVPTMNRKNNILTDFSLSMFPLKKLLGNKETNPYKLNLYYDVLPSDCTLYTLHQFYRGRDGLVSLMCYFKDMEIRLVVGKLFTVRYKNSESAYHNDVNRYKTKIQNEVEGWKAFNVKVQQFVIKKENNPSEDPSFPSRKTMLFLPFCFTPNENDQFDTEFSYFNTVNSTDFTNYLPDMYTERLNEKISENEPTEDSLEERLDAVVDQLKGKFINYEDREIRHLGLMPKRMVTNNKEVCDYEYVLLDHSANTPINRRIRRIK